HGHSQEFAVIIRNGNQAITIKNFHPRGLEGHEFFFAKLSQHTIEMNGGEPQCVGKLILSEWTIEAVRIANTASAHPIGQFQHKICRSYQGASASNIGQMFYEQRTLSRKKLNKYET